MPLTLVSFFLAGFGGGGGGGCFWLPTMCRAGVYTEGNAYIFVGAPAKVYKQAIDLVVSSVDNMKCSLLRLMERFCNGRSRLLRNATFFCLPKLRGPIRPRSLRGTGMMSTLPSVRTQKCETEMNILACCWVHP